MSKKQGSPDMARCFTPPGSGSSDVGEQPRQTDTDGQTADRDGESEGHRETPGLSCEKTQGSAKNIDTTFQLARISAPCFLVLSGSRGVGSLGLNRVSRGVWLSGCQAALPGFWVTPTLRSIQPGASLSYSCAQLRSTGF